jgi:anti-sigma-K factor RskA
MSSGERPIPVNGCEENAAPYVLGALTDDELAAFLAHLDTCTVCREEVASLQTVAAALAGAVPPLPAPGGLKRRVMSQVRADEQGESSRRERPSQQRSRSLGRWRAALAPALAGAAAVALLVVLLVSGGGGGTRVIRAQVSAPGASAVVRVTGAHAEMTLTGMPQTGPGHIYEVWLKRAGAPEPTNALFTVTRGGAATVGVPGSTSGVKDVLVTAEPLGGTRVPTTAPVIVAKLG